MKYFVTGIVALVVLLLFLAVSPFKTIDEGEMGVVLRFNKVDRVMEPGFHWKTPVVEKVVVYDVRTQKLEVPASAASKDLQIVKATVAMQYNVIPTEVSVLYAEVGKNYDSVIIAPAVQDVLKATTALFNAEELITKRVEVKAAAEVALKERLAEGHIFVSNVDIVNFDFSEEFNAAIEQKQVQEQEALKEVNITRQEEEKKKQAILQAEAVAQKTRLEAQALSINANIIDKILAEAKLEAAKNWNGVLPTHMYGSAPIPLVNITQ